MVPIPFRNLRSGWAARTEAIRARPSKVIATTLPQTPVPTAMTTAIESTRSVRATP